MIESRLIERIQSECLNKEPVIIAICGAADLGKSYLSQLLVKRLNEIGISAGHLTLDSFLMARDKRQSKGLSGYQIESYDLERSREALSSFNNGYSIQYSPYDHVLGKNSSTIEKIEDCTILIFDGLHALFNDFKEFIDFSIFIYTEDKKLKAIRTESDRNKRGQSLNASQLNSDTELNLYKKHVEPYKKASTCKLYLKKRWVYELQE